MKKTFLVVFLFLCTTSHVLQGKYFFIPSSANRWKGKIEPATPFLLKGPLKRYISQPCLHLTHGMSMNWTGYVATAYQKKASPVGISGGIAGSVSRVSGFWRVPAISSPTSGTSCAIWVGMDGYSNSTLEQIGTLHTFSQGVQQNYAWFEMYPQTAYMISNFPVNSNDLIGANVSYIGKDRFRLIIVNYTQNVYVVIPSRYTTTNGAQRSSAQWIVEASNSTPNGAFSLPNFSQITLNRCSTTVQKKNGSITSSRWGYNSVSMLTQSGGITKAHPSNTLYSGKTFNVIWTHE